MEGVSDDETAAYRREGGEGGRGGMCPGMSATRRDAAKARREGDKGLVGNDS